MALNRLFKYCLIKEWRQAELASERAWLIMVQMQAGQRTLIKQLMWPTLHCPCILHP
jgi:hypothetical protein